MKTTPEFNNWVFDSLVSCGAIKDYSKTSKSGRGKPPKGNLSIQVQRIAQLRRSTDSNEEMWGIIAYAGLQAEGVIGSRFKSVVDEYSKKYNPEDPAKLTASIEKAAFVANAQFKARYKDNPKGE